MKVAQPWTHAAESRPIDHSCVLAQAFSCGGAEEVNHASCCFITSAGFVALFAANSSAEILVEEAQRCNNTCRPLLKGVTPLKEAKRVVHNCLIGCMTQAQTEDSFMICPDGIGYRLRQPESDCSTKWKALTNN